MQTYTIYFPNPEDPPVSVPSAAYHYLHDVLGSVIGLVDETGLMRERYTYDPYGKVFIEKWDAAANSGNGAWAASETDCGSSTCGKLPVSSVGNPFMWTGHRYDAAVGLYATLYRTYSPTLGRWLQRDPIEYEAGSINLYEYVHSAPLLWVDPLGLTELPPEGQTPTEPRDNSGETPPYGEYGPPSRFNYAGFNKGRGDDPFYDLTDDELDQEYDRARRDGDNKRAERIKRIQKEKGKRRSRQNREDKKKPGECPESKPEKKDKPNGEEPPPNTVQKACRGVFVLTCYVYVKTVKPLVDGANELARKVGWDGRIPGPLPPIIERRPSPFGR